MLEVRDVTDTLLKGVSFPVRRGEILGFSGLVGAGQNGAHGGDLRSSQAAKRAAC